MKFTLSTRLSIWYSLLLLIALALFGVVSFLFVSKELYDEQYKILNETAEEISEVIRLRGDEIDVDYLIKESDELNLQESGTFFELLAEPAGLVYRSRNFPRFLTTTLTNPQEGSQRQVKDETGAAFHIFTYASRLPRATDSDGVIYIVRVGRSVMYVKRVLTRIRNLLLMMAPVVLLAAGLSGWLLARRSLQPVVQITNTAREITLYQLDRRLPVPEQNDELKQLVLTFNAMIERIETGVDKIRQFTADASHELRTPLTVLRGEIEVALRRPRDNQMYVSTLKSCLQELHWMEKIVNDLLLLSRADAGELSLQIERVDLVKLLKDCLSMQQYPAAQKHITLDFHSPQETLEHKIDPDRMRQVVMNILDNAINYTPKNGAVRVELQKIDPQVIMSVSDTGIGIPKKDMPFVFDRFYRVDKSRSREHRSSGLGLAICKWIVKAHDGTIGIDSEEGKGTTVRVTI